MCRRALGTPHRSRGGHGTYATGSTTDATRVSRLEVSGRPKLDPQECALGLRHDRGGRHVWGANATVSPSRQRRLSPVRQRRVGTSSCENQLGISALVACRRGSDG